MNEIECLQAECKALKYELDKMSVEKDKFATLYEESLIEKTELERKNAFLLGQIEAYKYCIKNIGGD